MIAIIDYGMGNIHSVQKALELMGAKTIVTNKPAELLSADKAVLPGVGAFDDAVKEMEKSGLMAALADYIKSKRIFLGICLGMQLLFETSEEAKAQKGLGVLKGTVKKFVNKSNLKVPHMGWNQLQIKNNSCALLKDIPDNSFVYFCHSFYPKPENSKVIAATSDYGVEFSSIVWQDNIYGVQFHPEKSQEVGLKNVKELCRFMLIIPAIDIQGGCVVRFVQGSLDKKVYSRDPVKTAKHWVKQGAKLIHVVDLDGAFTGTPRNLEIAKQIAKAIDVPIQFGGGVRNMEMIEKILDCAAQRVILGTKAAQDKSFLKKAFKKFKDKIIVSIDTKDDKVLTKGWQASQGKMDALKFADTLKTIGFKKVIYTDVLKDGTLKGPNIMAIKKLMKETGLKVIASGGISSLNDIQRLKLLEKKGLTGVIVGKALYEGRFTLAEALKFS